MKPTKKPREMKQLSANTLYHFTKTKDNLINILNSNFYPRYSIEDWSVLSTGDSVLDNEAAVPVVCFCDIPLSQIYNHMSFYGNYAIGLKKDWGERNKVSPLMYCHNNSIISNRLITIRNEFEKHKAKTKLSFTSLIDILRFVKPYQGFQKNIDDDIVPVRFYDEREWRYVPVDEIREAQSTEDNTLMLTLYKSRYKPDGNIDWDYINENNRKIEKFSLDFTPDDIKYIIVKSEEERYEIAKQIEDIKGDKFSKKDIKVLTTKIISVEQILEDF